MIFDWTDFEACRNRIASRSYQVCVAGGGPAGITIARALERKGHTVALFEGGGEEPRAESQAVYQGEIIGQSYFPLNVTRLRFLGGSSNHWNGWCRPLDDVDFERRTYHPYSGWPISKQDLDPFAPETEEILELPAHSPPGGNPFEADGSLQTVRFRWSRPPVRFGGKYREDLETSDEIDVFLNANVMGLPLDSAGARVRGFRISGFDEDTELEVPASLYALCMGGLENPRLLLNAVEDRPNGLGNGSGNVGRFFSEHPHFTIAHLQPRRTLTTELTNFAPTQEFMQEDRILNFNLRLPATDRRARFSVRSMAFLCGGPFREWLGSLLLGQDLDCDRPWDLGFPVRIASEQGLEPESRVKLGTDVDAFGLRRIRLDWRVGDLTFRTMRSAALELGRVATERGLGRVRVQDWLLEDRVTLPPVGEDEVGGHHHMCTTRMSSSPRSGVVDRNCRLHEVPNLFVGGSSTFASGGYANPTFTIIQLCLRLAKHLSAELKRR